MLTQEPYNRGQYTLRIGTDVKSNVFTKETSWKLCEEQLTDDNWCQYNNSYLSDYRRCFEYETLEHAKRACLLHDSCSGITQVRDIFRIYICLIQ